MGERQFAPAIYTGLKGIFRAFVVRAFGYQKVAAGFTRVGQQAISDYGAVAAQDFVPVDVLLDLCRASGDVSVLREMAEQLGYRLVQRPSAAGLPGVALGRITGRAMKETGDVFARYGQMVEDGTLSSVEGTYLKREIGEAIEALVLMDMQVDEEAGLSRPEGRT